MVDRIGNEGEANPKNSDLEEEEGSELPSKFNFTIRDDDDDEVDANEDPSLKIVQKPMSNASYGADRDGEDAIVLLEYPITGGGVADVSRDLVDLSGATKKCKKEKKKKKKKKIGRGFQSVDVVMEGEKSSGQDTVDNPDNAVLRRLLRGPRYFDLQDNSWGTCYNCGEEGHAAANCKSAKRKKPCFVCGSFEHESKRCQKGRDCFICKQSDHFAKDCPAKSKSSGQGSDLCLKCGSLGHVMFWCTNNYSPDDLEGIQCYVCKSFGHVCCANYSGTLPSEVSCYKCGQLGHSGLACIRTIRSQREVDGEWTPSSCFKCGEEGHFARECESTVKVKKRRRRDLSTPKKKANREGKPSKGYKSAPQDPSKARKKRKLQLDEELVVSSSQQRKRGGWIMDEPGDLPQGNYTRNRGWQSPKTPSAKKYRTPNRYASNSRSPRKYNGSLERTNNWSSYGRSPNSQGDRFQHGYSASRFGNPSSGGLSKEHQWW